MQSTGSAHNSADPERIAISRSGGIEIDWRDGHHSDYGLQYLRDRCPCATCTGAHKGEKATPAEAAPFLMYKPVLRILDVEPAGNYALRIHWSDGHNTGIYTFDYFRQVCPCQECGS